MGDRKAQKDRQTEKMFALQKDSFIFVTWRMLRFDVDFQIADRQNVEIRITDL
jgi:hypothetical protein